MHVNLIVAMDRTGLIGLDGQLPWQNYNGFRQEDMAHFKQTTMGHPCIMGHGTFKSLSRRLTGRREIVLSKSPALAVTWNTDVLVAGSLDAAVSYYYPQVPFVIGGAQVYRELLKKSYNGLSYVTLLGCTVKFLPGQDATYFPLKPEDLGVLGEKVSETTTAYATYLVYRR